MLHVLYLAHDVADPAIRRRTLTLQAGGANVTVAGFRRGTDTPRRDGVIELDVTKDGRFAQRIVAVMKTAALLRGKLCNVRKPDVIIARNLEMLALANRANAIFGGKVPIVYECLDIHRLLLRKDFAGRVIRAVEHYLGRNVSLLVTSSPAFIDNYFRTMSRLKAPVMLLENQVIALEEDAETPAVLRRTPLPGEPWKIGWFGALRCRKSLTLLSEFTRAMGGKFEVVLRGRPAYSEFDDFDGFVKNEPFMTFQGAYKNPEDLADIYNEVQFSWGIDFFEEGLNSSWLLPNRLYEGCRYGAIPIALAGTETARYVAAKGIGLVLDRAGSRALDSLLADMTAERYEAEFDRVAAIDPASWTFDRADCQMLVRRLAALRTHDAPAAPLQDSSTDTEQQGWTAMNAGDLQPARCLIVIPCLNEARHIEPLIAKLGGALANLDANIVVADGGSTDGTRDIVQRIAAANPRVSLIANPKKIQSAAVNLAIATLGADYDYMIRIDAHGEYPADYCQRLVEDAIATDADSVVVAMQTVGFSTFQKATAFAQNSKLGNGGSKHRTGSVGHWADHGHHALMRISAFQAIGGYDEMFSHNEDAEFDYRLNKAGYKIWMTDKTSMIYYPRSTAGTLFRQYFGYGRGRAKNFMKHRALPSIRQMLPLAVAPVAVGSLLAVVNWAAIIPFGLWAVACLGYGVWMALGQKNPYGPLAAISAMVMHFAWSAGFWRELLDFRNRRVAS